MFSNSKVLIGISGGIAAYKIPLLIRLFRKAEVEVKVVCTEAALKFVSPLTLECVSENKVYCNLFNSTEKRSTDHISHAEWGDVLLVAPATANVLAKMAHGIADDALSTLYLAFKGKVVVAPAMNTQMYEHPATQENLNILKNRGVLVLSPEEGELACGAIGVGRMAEVESIYEYIKELCSTSDKGIIPSKNCEKDFVTSYWQGKKVLLTAGPTREDIDPVRYISNRSSGKMGFCISDALTSCGADVYLVSGPTHIEPKFPPLYWQKVETAVEMFDFCTKIWADMDMGIMSAAVADYRIKQKSSTKIKKSGDKLNLELEQNPDILAYLGQHKKEKQYLVGFALETDNALENARKKLKAKNADLIVLNSLENPGAGFETPTNRITMVSKKGKISESPLESKEKIAFRILHKIQKSCLLLLLLIVFGLPKVYSQELNCTLQVVSTKIQSGDKKIFESMQKAFVQFVNGRKWTNLQVGSGEKIACSMTFDVQERDYNTGATKAYLTVQVRRPVYNSSYSSNLINILDRDVSFTYNEFDPLEFSDNNVSSNLSAILGYYCYMIIAEYLDSFAPRAGEYCFSKAENIVNMSQSFSEGGWKPNERNTRNRYWMAENYMNGSFGDIHNIIYLYHRKGMDNMYDNPIEARKYIYEALRLFKKLNEIKLNLPCKQLFMEAKADEIVSIFSAATAEEKEKIMALLSEIDASNTQKYQKIKNSK